MHSCATVVIPLDDGVVFIGALDGAEFGGWLPKVAQTLDAIAGSQFRVGTDGRSRGTAWARSESGIAPTCDKGGCGDLRSLDGGLPVCVIFRFSSPSLLIFLAC